MRKLIMKVYHSLKDIPIPDFQGRVAIKLHMGDRTNKTHITPDEAGIVFDRLKAQGCKPFLFDTTTLYKRERYTVQGYEEVARLHGFGRFPVVIADDNKVKIVRSGGFEIPLPAQLLEADGLFVLSHATGHIDTIFAAAIKNMAMGCVVKKGKYLIHSQAQPVYHKDLCKVCGACVKACSSRLIAIKKDGITIDYSNCSACGRCVDACPNGALETTEQGIRKSYDAFAAAARAVVDQFPGRIYFATVLKRITKMCDCAKDGGAFISKDLGYVAGHDPLELDMESAKLIRPQAPGMEWKKWDWFVEACRKHF